MRFRISAAFALGAVLVLGSTACKSSRTYANKADDGYDLAAMSLSPADLPAGFDDAGLPDHVFDNQQWADVLGAADPAAKQAQLDAQGRIKAYVSVFQAQSLGRILSITSISTLYKDAQSATDSAKQYACGIPIDDKTPLDSFAVPTLGDQSAGFLTIQDRGNGQSFTDTNFCFRTGRIVHVVQQTSIPGVEDIALSVRLANVMLQHVNDSFDGKRTAADVPTPAPAPTSSGDQLVPLSPSANGTATGAATPNANGTSTGAATPNATATAAK
jgi:hypothetical protein